MYELTMSKIHLMIYSAIYSMIYSTIHLFQPLKADGIGNVSTRRVVWIHRQKALGCLRPPSYFLPFHLTQGYAPRPVLIVMNFVRIRSSILGPRHEPATEAALQSPLERVAFTTFRLPLKYRFSLNQAKRMSAFRSRFDQLLYEHFYDAR